MSLLEKAQELVGKAKHAAGRITGDHDTSDAGDGGEAKPIRDEGQDRISEAAQDARDRYRGN